MSVMDRQASFTPGEAAAPCSQVEISVSCRNLTDADTFSKSDPMCVLSAKNLGSKKYYEVGRTEEIKDTLNPDFVKKFIMDYYFEERQKLRFDVYDIDSQSRNLDKHDYLGGIECTLGEIVASTKLERKLTGLRRNKGVITLRAEELSSCKDLLHLQMEGTKLDKKDLLGKSDPFLVFYRTNTDQSYTVVHKTEVIKKTLNPKWRPFSIPVASLCRERYDMPIKVECYDWNRSGTHELIGEFMTSVSRLRQGPGAQNMYEVINMNKKSKSKKKGYTNSGTISMRMCRVEKRHTFLEYVQGGMEVSFTVAIDFTASNGNPKHRDSLHYYTEDKPSPYAQALQAVGEVIQDYDSDKMFPALGFGAKLPPDGVVSHEFFLNGHPTNPHCEGISGVIQAYHNTIQSVQLYGPTNFSPIINHVARFAAAYTDGSNYFILLILTDGVITDMQQTKKAIVEAARLPMSIIIVGIGKADFTAMDELDGDEQRVSHDGVHAERDIVQFVPFREFVGGKYGSSLSTSQAHLAKEVLAEVPDQVTSYMMAHNIDPKPTKKAHSDPLTRKHGFGYSATVATDRQRRSEQAPPLSNTDLHPSYPGYPTHPPLTGMHSAPLPHDSGIHGSRGTHRGGAPYTGGYPVSYPPATPPPQPLDTTPRW